MSGRATTPRRRTTRAAGEADTRTSSGRRTAGAGRRRGPVQGAGDARGAQGAENHVDPACRVEGGARHAERLRAEALRHLAALRLRDAELSLSLVDDAAIRRLNRRWRGKDAATDVLSFPAGAWAGAGPRVLGDVVISLDTARRQARALGERLPAELSRYLVHGLLHLLGFDHERPTDARRMRAAERRLLRGVGMLERAGEGARASRARRAGEGPATRRP